jgi:hypothetical protein
VKTVKGQNPVIQPDAGKALVYSIEDDSAYGSGRKLTTRAGTEQRRGMGAILMLLERLNAMV